VKPFRDLVLPDDTLADWEQRRKRMYKRVMYYFGEGPQEKCDLKPEWGEKQAFDGYTRQHVTYEVEEGQKAFAWLFIPADITAPAPVVMCYHGTSRPGKEFVSEDQNLAEKPNNMGYAVELARRGYVTFAPDQWATGERLGLDGEFFRTDNLYKRHPEWSLEGKTAYDHMRAVDLVQTLPEADISKLGAIGHSRGGSAVIYQMLHDERVKVGVPSCGTCPYYGNFWLKHLAHQLPYSTIKRFDEEIKNGKEPGYDIHEVLALLAPRPLLLVSPFRDDFCRCAHLFSEIAEKVFNLYEFLGKENNFSRFAHGEGHNTGPILRAAMYAFFDYHLKGEVPGLPGTNYRRRNS